MKAFPNFFENQKEASLRLLSCIVLYDGKPYHVLTIAEHLDGILRAYLAPIVGHKRPWDGLGLENYPPGHPLIVGNLDAMMKSEPDRGIIRKKMNSPLFNKFRPFPLGMCNVKGNAYYIERQPTRKSEQGLTRSMLYERRLTAGGMSVNSMNIDMYSQEFEDCILGRYPSAADCLAGLRDPAVLNEAVGFHRNFGLIRGPIGSLYLAYKDDVVGVLMNGDFSLLRLSEEFKHVREAVEDLKIFNAITV